MTGTMPLDTRPSCPEPDAWPETRWRLPSPTKPPICDWEGDCVAYNPLSGDTHILDIVAGRALKLISAGGPLGTGEICRHIASFLEVPDDARLTEHVGQILARLDECGLIEPAA